MGNTDSAKKDKKKDKNENEPPVQGDFDRAHRADSNDSNSSRRRSVSNAEGLKLARAFDRAGSGDGVFDPDDPLGGFDADAPDSDAEPDGWGSDRLASLREALRVRLESMGPEESVSVKALRREQVGVVLDGWLVGG